jgi:hypothetical protein
MSRNSLKDVRKSQMMPDQVALLRLRQKKRSLYAAGFDALVKRWDKCINVGGGYVEKHFAGSNYHMFYVLYPFVTCLLTLPRRFTV